MTVGRVMALQRGYRALPGRKAGWGFETRRQHLGVYYRDTGARGRGIYNIYAFIIERLGRVAGESIKKGNCVTA